MESSLSSSLCWCAQCNKSFSIKLFSDHMKTVHGKVEEDTKLVAKKRKPGPASKTGRNVKSDQTDDIYDELKSEETRQKKRKIGLASKTGRTKEESSGNRDENENSHSDDDSESSDSDHGIPKDLPQSSDDDSEDDYELPFKLPLDDGDDDIDSEQPPMLAQPMGSFVPLNKSTDGFSDESESDEEHSSNTTPEVFKKRRPGPASRTGRSVENNLPIKSDTNTTEVSVKRKPGPSSRTGKIVQKDEILQEEITNLKNLLQSNADISDGNASDDEESFEESIKETSDEETSSEEELEDGELIGEDLNNFHMENGKISDNIVGTVDMDLYKDNTEIDDDGFDNSDLDNSMESDNVDIKQLYTSLELFQKKEILVNGILKKLNEGDHSKSGSDDEVWGNEDDEGLDNSMESYNSLESENSIESEDVPMKEHDDNEETVQNEDVGTKESSIPFNNEYNVASETRNYYGDYGTNNLEDPLSLTPDPAQPFVNPNDQLPFPNYPPPIDFQSNQFGPNPIIYHPGQIFNQPNPYISQTGQIFRQPNQIIDQPNPVFKQPNQIIDQPKPVFTQPNPLFRPSEIFDQTNKIIIAKPGLLLSQQSPDDVQPNQMTNKESTLASEPNPNTKQNKPKTVSKQPKLTAAHPKPAVPKRSAANKWTLPDDQDESKIKLSNDMADACKTLCKLCNEPIKLVAMRGHTKSKHMMPISEYKSKFGIEYEIIEEIYHKCAICETIILLDSDSVAVHLKSQVHKVKDPNGTTHKQYNEKYMTKMIMPKKQGK